MVTQCGFSDALGNVDLSSDYNSLSSDTKQKIEYEVRRLIEEGRERATKLLSSKRKELDLVANALVEYEVLNLDEMQKVLRGEKLQKIKALPSMPIKMPDIVLPPGIGGGVPGPGPGAGVTSTGSGGNSSRPGEDGGAKL